MKKTISLIFTTFCCIAFVNAQQLCTISGHVKDKNTGEDLIGAVVRANAVQGGALTNAYGFYSFSLPAGTYVLHVSYVGYTTSQDTLRIDKSIEYNASLSPTNFELKEVEITENRPDENVRNIQMSVNKLDINQIKKLPALLGEVDIIKIVQMQPGVLTIGEGTSAFFVRGGSADQNLILMDEAPVYDPSHLLGLFSIFNADAVKSVELYKGGIPARFGGRLSSILDVRTKDGNSKKFGMVGGFSVPLGARVMVEGPIKKDKITYLVSARTSYLDKIVQGVSYVFKRNWRLPIRFYDMNAKINWSINSKNRLYLSLYKGHDNIGLSDQFDFGWGNTTGSLRWNHLFNDKLFLNTTLIASRFDYRLQTGDFIWTSNVSQLSLHNDFTYYIGSNNELNFGYQVSRKAFEPATLHYTSGEKVRVPNQYSFEQNLYVDHQVTLAPRFDVRYGVRLSINQAVGKAEVLRYVDPNDYTHVQHLDTLYFKSGQVIKTYINPEPRVAFRYSVNEKSSVKLSYNRMVQNVHLIANGSVPLPFNTWLPSGYYLKPQLADQVAIGYFRNFKNNTYEFSTEAYYKKMKNVVDFVDNADAFTTPDITPVLRQGVSTAYGIEFGVQKTRGVLTGFLNYTLSKVVRTIPNVNQGREYYASYDRRHALNCGITYDFSKSFSIGTTFVYYTGRPFTVPIGSYSADGYNVPYFSDRNGYRMPAYMRLDCSITFVPKKSLNRRFKSQWVLGLYNIMARNNPFMIIIDNYYRMNKVYDAADFNPSLNAVATPQMRTITLFEFLPCITYNFKF